MIRLIAFSLILFSCKKGPEDMGRELGVLTCNHAKELLHKIAGNSKQKKSAEKEIKKIDKKIKKIESKLKKLSKKKQQAASKATASYVSKVCSKPKK